MADLPNLPFLAATIAEVIMMVLGELGPGQLGPGQLGPGLLGPGQLGPGQLGPGQLGPWTVGPRTVGPQTVGPWGRNLPTDIYPPIVGRIYPIPVYKFNGHVFPKCWQLLSNMNIYI